MDTQATERGGLLLYPACA